MDILKVFFKKKIELKTLVYTELPDNAKIINGSAKKNTGIDG